MAIVGEERHKIFYAFTFSHLFHRYMPSPKPLDTPLPTSPLLKNQTNTQTNIKHGNQQKLFFSIPNRVLTLQRERPSGHGHIPSSQRGQCSLQPSPKTPPTAIRPRPHQKHRQKTLQRSSPPTLGEVRRRDSGLRTPRRQNMARHFPDRRRGRHGLRPRRLQDERRQGFAQFPSRNRGCGRLRVVVQ